MNEINIPYNKPSIVGKELEYIRQAVDSGKISGDGIFSKRCSDFMQEKYLINKVLLTTSCSTALDMASILINIEPGDEVILPSYTFVSTANSFYMRGAKLRFVDIREDTLNIDENKIEKEITPRTMAIVPVHYAGVSSEMNKILDIARKNNIFVIEDAAQGIESKYKDNYLGAMGDIGCYSFHETKNVICGEGGAILINNEEFL
jgi:dTDP-4-amino-4,6-dideoxygalactose transaminase